jgi:hypothetical protein
MPFVEEPDLADMLSDAGVNVTWQPPTGPAITRKGLYHRQTEELLPGQGGSEMEEVPSVLVEVAYFRGIAEGAALTVDTPDGTDWVVRQVQVPQRALLRLYLAIAPVVS